MLTLWHVFREPLFESPCVANGNSRRPDLLRVVYRRGGGGRGHDNDLDKAPASSNHLTTLRVVKEFCYFYISRRALKIQNYFGFVISSLLFSIYPWVQIGQGVTWALGGRMALQCLTQPFLYHLLRPPTPVSNICPKHLRSQHTPGACWFSVSFSPFKELPVIFSLTFSCGKH